MITLPFDYNGNRYSALVCEKVKEDSKEYRFTIMNGDLEKLLYGSHILVERNGEIQPPQPLDEEKQPLVLQLIRALKEFLVCSV